ncbi:phospholipase effector Tle1 domain-containing protein [Cystobacter fuscus]
MVEDCLHMVAAHELRNSFPVDSLLQGLESPSNCREMLYPGAHSDVGGGYRPGEGARSRTNGSLLSMIPLRVMREQAIQAGVPLGNGLNSQDFAEDAASKESFELLHQRFTGYMNAVGWGEQSLGAGVLAHMKRYYQWRFHRITRDRNDRAARRPTKDETLLREFQTGGRPNSRACPRTRKRSNESTSPKRNGPVSCTIHSAPSVVSNSCRRNNSWPTP